MEKKPNSIRQTSAKGLVSESRKQDVAKPWPRSGRRRESNFSNSKSEPLRPSNKQQQQQQQQSHVRANFDKRFRGGSGNGYQRGISLGQSLPSSNSGLDDDIDTFVVELNSVYAPGSKKQSLNHLLNFNYAPRERADVVNYSRNGNHQRYYAYGMGAGKKSRYNKEHFLQATCQFVVNAEYDYTWYKTGCPDMLVEWNYIEQINVQTSDEPQCPICLYPPIAGKMTRCGHVYCWPCILQYLSLSDRPWRKCPICYESIQVDHLKSTISKPYPLYSVDDYVTFQLMCREKGSLQLTKINQMKTSDFPHLSYDADELLHTKLIMCNDTEIMTIIERERGELTQQLALDGLECPESVFISQALSLLEQREKTIKNVDKKLQQKQQIPLSIDATINVATEKIQQLKLNVAAKPFSPINNEIMADLHQDRPSECIIIDEETNLTLQDIEITPTIKDSNHFFFYQSADGQHLYLHSINVRMLQTMYGSLDKAPHTITGRILQKESCSITDELRKRLKYLQHLPVTSQFDVVEIDLSKQIVSADVLKKFKDELMLRQKTRQRRAREERQREKHINEVNDRQIGKIIAQSANIDVTSNRQFPLCGSFESPNFNEDPFLPSIYNSPTTSIDIAANNSTSPPTPGPSFATMLTRQTKEQELWPSLGTPKTTTTTVLQDPKTPVFLAGNKNVSHRKKKQPSYNSDLDGDDDIDETFTTTHPVFNNNFGGNKNTSRNNNNNCQPSTTASTVDSCMAAITVPAAGTSSTKKKKTKKTILFSTSARPFDGK